MNYREIAEIISSNEDVGPHHTLARARVFAAATKFLRSLSKELGVGMSEKTARTLLKDKQIQIALGEFFKNDDDQCR